MIGLGIGRLSATVHAAPDDQDREPRIRRLLGRIADHRLHAALQSVTLPPGDWCVRRVDLALPVDLDRPDPAIEAQWARALVDAVRAALVDGSPDVVYFPRRSEAVADLVASVALGQLERQWAWTQLGLLQPGDPPLGSTPAAAVLTVLRRHPESALVAVAAAVRVAGAAPIHRLLGTHGWVAVAAVTFSAGSPAGATAILRSASEHDDVRVSQHHGAAVSDHQAVTLATAMLQRSSLAVALRRSRIRPDEQTARAWAVLVAAQADPAVLRRSAAPAVITNLATRLGGPPPDTATRALATPTREVICPGQEQHSPAHHEPGSPGTNSAASAAAPDVPSTAAPGAPAGNDQKWPTPWAGLLFLLSTAEQAGVPDELLADPAFDGQPLWWVLHAVATRLVPAAPDDPAVLTLAGLRPGDELESQQPSAGEAARLAYHSRRWAAVTAERLGRADEDPFEVVTELALRRGEVLAQPGWSQVHLRHDEVDIDVRRAALDVDPGWVPWLGVVVRFSYE